MAARMPKLHFVDTGLASHLLGLRTEDRLLTSPHYGALLETLVFMECAKHAEWADEEVRLYHFRDKRKREVDIVLERTGGGIVGVEVKPSATIRREDFKGLSTLAELSGAAFEHGVLFYTGGRGAAVPPGGGADVCAAASDGDRVADAPEALALS